MQSTHRLSCNISKTTNNYVLIEENGMDIIGIIVLGYHLKMAEDNYF